MGASFDVSVCLTDGVSITNNNPSNLELKQTSVAKFIDKSVFEGTKYSISFFVKYRPTKRLRTLKNKNKNPRDTLLRQMKYRENGLYTLSSYPRKRPPLEIRSCVRFKRQMSNATSFDPPTVLIPAALTTSPVRALTSSRVVVIRPARAIKRLPHSSIILL